MTTPTTIPPPPTGPQRSWGERALRQVVLSALMLGGGWLGAVQAYEIGKAKLPGGVEPAAYLIGAAGIFVGMMAGLLAYSILSAGIWIVRQSQPQTPQTPPPPPTPPTSKP